MENSEPLDDLEMHEILRLIYPQHIQSDEDEYFEASRDVCRVWVPLGDGVEVELADLLGRVVMLTMPMQSSLSGKFAHCLGELTKHGDDWQMRAAVRRECVPTTPK